MTVRKFVEDASPYPWIEKATAAELDYGNDYTDWLAESGSDTIASSVWTVPPGLINMAPAKPATIIGGVTTVWLSGGTLGARYDVVNTITTASGRVDTRTFTIRVVAR